MSKQFVIISSKVTSGFCFTSGMNIYMNMYQTHAYLFICISYRPYYSYVSPDPDSLWPAYVEMCLQGAAEIRSNMSAYSGYTP